jgi:hypothetical protein
LAGAEVAASGDEDCEAAPVEGSVGGYPADHIRPVPNLYLFDPTVDQAHGLLLGD